MSYNIYELEKTIQFRQAELDRELNQAWKFRDLRDEGLSLHSNRNEMLKGTRKGNATNICCAA